jgi:hypothetical protein
MSGITINTFRCGARLKAIHHTTRSTTTLLQIRAEDLLRETITDLYGYGLCRFL